MTSQYISYFLSAVFCLLELSMYNWYGLWRFTGLNVWVYICMLLAQIHITISCALFFIYIVSFCKWIGRCFKLQEDGSLSNDSYHKKLDPFKLIFEV